MDQALPQVLVMDQNGFSIVFSSIKYSPPPRSIGVPSASGAKEQEERWSATCTQFQLFHQFLTVHLQAKVTQMS